jgi:cytochrome P450
VGQAFQFLTARFETSGSTLSYAMYELALQPEIQYRLRAEIMKVLNKQRRADIRWHTGDDLPGHGCVRSGCWSKLYCN